MNQRVQELELPPLQQGSISASCQSNIRLQRILVPVDLLAGSIESVRYATALASEFGASITLLHVIQLNIGGEELGIPRFRLLNEMGEQARTQLRALLNQLWDCTATAQTVIGVGRPHREIVDQAIRLDSDLIIMSAHKYTGLLRLLRPNTAERVIRVAPCPVLVLHAQEHGFIEPSLSGRERKEY